MDQTTPLAPIKDAVEDLVTSYNHRRSRFIDIDFKIDDQGHMQFHIFPRVPTYETFLPDPQKFASALEQSVIKLFGKAADVSAAMHEFNGSDTTFVDTQGTDGKPSAEERNVIRDTRVKAYLRKENGDLTQIIHSNPVDMAWVCVRKIPGLMMPKEQAMRMLLESFVENTERLVPRA